MRIFNSTPFVLAPFGSEVAPPALSLTFILKGTFTLKPDAPCEVAKKQRPLEGDRRHLDEIGRSPAWASDLAPFKPHTDFFVLGAFHQPGGRPAPEGRASFELGPLRKELAFFGPRVATQIAEGNWHIGAPEPMTSVPLRWEFSFGGLGDKRNPMGMGIDPLEPAPGEKPGPRRIPLPQIEDPRFPLQRIGQRPAPANFAPVPASFQERRRKLGTRDRRWQVFRSPLPPKDYDPSYHNAAPGDQQAGNHPRGDEKLILRNLHPKIPELVTALPGLRPRLALVRLTAAGPVAEEVRLHLDTIVAVPDEDQLVLLWRGVTEVHTRIHPDEIPMVACDMEPLGPTSTLDDMQAKLLARYLEENSDAGQKAHDAEVMAGIREMLGKASLPPELAKLVQTEADPKTLFNALDSHLGQLLADLERKYPPGSAG